MATLPDVPTTEIPNHYNESTDEFEPTFLQGRLDEVVDKINVRWGSVVERRLASGALPKRLYTATVVRVAARLFRNTEGYKTEQEGQYQYEVFATVASGTIWFTDDDERDLTGAVQDKKQQGGVIGTATIGRHRPGFA